METGAYSAKDILYFTKSPGDDDYARHKVSYIIFDKGVMIAYIQQPPDRRGQKWTSMDLSGPCSYLRDSTNNNLNIKVHGVGRFSIKSTAVPRILNLAERDRLVRTYEFWNPKKSATESSRPKEKTDSTNDAK